MGNIGSYVQGASVWVPAISRAPSGDEVNPTSCTGKYYKVGTVASTPLTFNQFDSETGVYYAIIDTSGLAVGMYAALVEAAVGAINLNAMHYFEVMASGAAAISVSAVTTGDCLSVAEIKALIDVTDYTDTQLQRALDTAFGKITGMLGHAFGRAFRIYHDESDGATAATITVDSTKVRLIITGGANAGTYDYTYALYPTIGALLDAITAADKGFVVLLLTVIPYDQPSANLKALAATSVLGFANRITAQFKQWTECMDGDNEHTKQLRMPQRDMVSVVEDSDTLVENSDYYAKEYNVYRVCCVGGGDCCWSAAYWSCRSTCNVCITYVPKWFGLCPEEFISALLGFVQLNLETQSSGHFKAEQIGDYRYSKGDLSADYAFYYQAVMKFEVAPKWPI